MKMSDQQTLPIFTHQENPADHGADRSCTFADNMRLPVHRWFRYSAGFSADWALETIRRCRPCAVLDPFAGSGTALLASEQAGTAACGFEAHPFIARVAEAKLSWNVPVREFLRCGERILEGARSLHPDTEAEAPLLHKCYDRENLEKLCALRDVFLQGREEMPPQEARASWLALTAILRPCSHAGTAQWQYVLPRKSKARVAEPFAAFRAKIQEMAEDMGRFRRLASSSARIIAHDAREPAPDLEGKIDLVVTSPPYPNNYDYGDCARLEMCFWKEVNGWSDLQKVARRRLVRSCSQHAAAEKLNLDELLQTSALQPIRDELTEICRALERERMNRGGRKHYHTMVAAYFADLAAVFRALRKACRAGCRMCFVIGDSAPYGIYVPADVFLARLASEAGFFKPYFEKLRDRNVKWKNRKHRVPLKEGRLWLEG